MLNWDLFDLGDRGDYGDFYDFKESEVLELIPKVEEFIGKIQNLIESDN